jgi:hypothetical protein
VLSGTPPAKGLPPTGSAGAASSGLLAGVLAAAAVALGLAAGAYGMRLRRRE